MRSPENLPCCGMVSALVSEDFQSISMSSKNILIDDGLSILTCVPTTRVSKDLFSVCMVVSALVNEEFFSNLEVTEKSLCGCWVIGVSASVVDFRGSPGLCADQLEGWIAGDPVPAHLNLWTFLGRLFRKHTRQFPTFLQRWPQPAFQCCVCQLRSRSAAAFRSWFSVTAAPVDSAQAPNSKRYASSTGRWYCQVPSCPLSPLQQGLELFQRNGGSLRSSSRRVPGRRPSARLARRGRLWCMRGLQADSFHTIPWEMPVLPASLIASSSGMSLARQS